MDLCHRLVVSKEVSSSYPNSQYIITRFEGVGVELGLAVCKKKVSN